jgi:hypothetical protein
VRRQQGFVRETAVSLSWLFEGKPDPAKFSLSSQVAFLSSDYIVGQNITFLNIFFSMAAFAHLMNDILAF